MVHGSEEQPWKSENQEVIHEAQMGNKITLHVYIYRKSHDQNQYGWS